jgi:hypothetical protein
MRTRIHVWYDQQGKIIAVGKPAKNMVNRVEPRPAKTGHSVLSVDVDDDSIKKIHHTYVVDVGTSQLKRKHGL